MEPPNEEVLEGVFAIAKPAFLSSADVLLKLQATFAPSKLFAPLLQSQPKRPSKTDENVFKMGHGGTLDPLAAGVLIVGIGRGTKHLNRYLACTKTYETVVLFGASTDTYDCTGVVHEQAPYEHVTKDLVEERLAQFRGKISQLPPIYSALKINGIKACEYVRQGKELPRELEAREMVVDECTLVQWYDGGEHDFITQKHDQSLGTSAARNNDHHNPGRELLHAAPAARIRLTVSSGFYVRSFAHDLGIACGSKSHMTSLLRTRQADYTTIGKAASPGLVAAITYDELEASEDTWASKLEPQLRAWIEANPVTTGHVNGRAGDTKRKLGEERENKPRQRFRGDWEADSKKERIKQQGGRYKGKWGRKTPAQTEAADAAEPKEPDTIEES